MLRFFLICFITILANQLTLGQENTIYLKSGVIETAQKVDIKYNPVNDDELSVLNNDGQSIRYKATEVDSVHFRDGQKYYTKSYQFYYKTEIKTKKSTFVRVILNGVISLYENDAFNNKLYLEKNNEFFQLRKLTDLLTDNNELGFSQIKFYLFPDCLSRDDIVDLELNKNNLINAVNKYNRCADGDYNTKVEAREKENVQSFSIYLGGNLSSYNFTSSIVSVKRSLGIAKTEGINTEESKSNAFSFNVEYMANFFKSERLYYFLDVGFTKFEYDLFSEDFSSIQSIKFDNVNVSFGPSIRLEPVKKVSSFTMVGPTVNYNSKVDEIIAIRTDTENGSVIVIPGEMSKSVQLSFVVKQVIDYDISKNFSLLLKADLYLLNGGLFKTDLRDYYNDNFGFFEPERQVTFEDSIQKRYLISLGFKYSLVKGGFY